MKKIKIKVDFTNKNLKFFFVGIGGIGMSALACYLSIKNYLIYGSDSDLENKTIQNCLNNKIKIFNEIDSLNQIKKINPNFIVLTNTVKIDHPIIKLANENNIKLIKRSELLGQLLKNKKIIGITGSHGKTSTTGLISTILNYSNYNPDILIGGFLESIKNNFQVGNSDYSIIEADDAYRSFLDLTPFISVVTSISLEHLETYKNMADIYKTFLKYINLTKKNGFIFINTDEKEIKNWSEKIKRKFFTYGLNKESNYYAADNIILNSFSSTYSFYKNNKFLGEVFLPLPGLHQIKNSVVSIAAAEKIGISFEKSIAALKNHTGVERRLTIVGKFKNTLVYDDYAHHPNEIENMLKVIGEILTKNGKKYLFFQPHKYTRTKALWNDFIKIFTCYAPDYLYITDVFSAGDDFDEFYNSKNLCEELKKNKINVKYVPFDESFKYLFSEIDQIKSKINKKDIIFCMGAGKLDKFAQKLIQYN